MPPVIDANVVIHGRGSYRFESAYTVPEVMDEMESSEARIKFDTNDIEVREPSSEYVKKVWRKSEEINARTSEADEKLLALGIELGEPVVTDDRGVQNLALHLDAEFRSFMQDPVEEKRSWAVVCENCGSKVEGDSCDRCGSSQLRRKPGQYS
ncbi:MAG: NOB1 family endonuclease [Candidatus Nanohaloarchaea archaeon]